MIRTVVTTIRMEPHLKKELQKLAKRLGTSMSKIVIAACKALLRGDICIEGMKATIRRPFAIQGKNGRLVFQP